jgi:hypothetical protein
MKIFAVIQYGKIARSDKNRVFNLVSHIAVATHRSKMQQSNQHDPANGVWDMSKLMCLTYAGGGRVWFSLMSWRG